MASPNLGLNLQTTGSNNGTWGIFLNSDLSIIDSRAGGRVTVNCAGSSNITVSASQAQNVFQTLTGVLTGSIEYILPSTAGGFYFITNNTTGAYTLKVDCVALGTGITIPQGRSCLIFVNPDAPAVVAALSYLPSLLVDALTTAALTVTGTTSFPVGSIDSSAIASLPSNPIPVGTIMDFAGSSTPGGFLLCYGQAINRVTYSALFAVIGTTYGVGDGSTTFNVPDVRGRIGAGKDDMGGVAAGRLTASAFGVDGLTLGASGGEQNHVLVIAELASHAHGNGSLVTSTAGSHSHTINAVINGTSTSSNVVLEGTNIVANPVTTNAAGDHSHSITGTMGTIGSDSGHNNVQPTIIFNKIIKT